MANRSSIPEKVKLAVRRKCGFCCILCGAMITEYEHIVPYSECGIHEEENIVLLCSLHHREVTSGRISKKEVESYAKRPFAFSGKGFPEYRIPIRNGARVLFGGNLIEECHFGPHGVGLVQLLQGTTLSVDLSEGFPQFSGSICLIKGEEVLRIEKNVITLRKLNIFDVSLRGRQFLLRTGHRKQLAKFRIHESEFSVEDLKALSPNSGVHIRKDGVFSLRSDGSYSAFANNYYSKVNINGGSFVSNQQGMHIAEQVKDMKPQAIWKWLFSAKSVENASSSISHSTFNNLSLASTPFPA